MYFFLHFIPSFQLVELNQQLPAEIVSFGLVYLNTNVESEVVDSFIFLTLQTFLRAQQNKFI